MKIDMLVNKEHPLDKDFVPEDLVIYTEYNGPKIDPNYKTLVDRETFNAFLEMQEAAKKDGHYIIIDSGYRSYEYQQRVLEDTISKKGEAAYSTVALPGTSEHQTGLAIDVALYRNTIYTDEFDENDPEIVWLRNNSYKYGFILRYPKGSEEITGFNYECWHFRYVGKDISYKMHDEGISTLEEYHEKYKKGIKL